MELVGRRLAEDQFIDTGLSVFHMFQRWKPRLDLRSGVAILDGRLWP